MISNDDFTAIEALDLDSIKTKLMHKKSGKGWSLQRASAVEREYRRFLYLMKKFPNEPTAPLVDVDTFWHYHILDTMKYAADCQHVFGYFLHHFPYVGMRGKEDEEALQRLGERMRAIYEETFGEDYQAFALAGESRPALSAGITLGGAYDAKHAGATSAGKAHCTHAIADAAYCVKPVGEPAYCVRAAVEAAYCVRAVVDAAYCVKPIPDAAYCVRPVGEPAYCVRAVLAAENSGNPLGEPAVVLMAHGGESEPADSTLAVVDTASDVATSAQTNCRQAASAGGLKRGGGSQPPSTQALLPEQRAAFYLERPRLPTA